MSDKQEDYLKESGSFGSQDTPPFQTTVQVNSIQEANVPARQESIDSTQAGQKTKKPWWYSIKEPGSAAQIVIAAAVALGIGLGVSSATEVPDAATTLLAIPGQLWLRALTCVGECALL